MLFIAVSIALLFALHMDSLYFKGDSDRICKLWPITIHISVDTKGFFRCHPLGIVTSL